MIEKFKKDEAARKKREEQEATALEAPPSDAVSAAPVISGPAQVRLAPPPPLAPSPAAAPGAAAAKAKAEALRVAALSSAMRPPSPMVRTDAEKAALSGVSTDEAILAMISKKRTEVRSQSNATECVSSAPDYSLIPMASNHAGKESAERVQAGLLRTISCAHLIRARKMGCVGGTADRPQKRTTDGRRPMLVICSSCSAAFCASVCTAPLAVLLQHLCYRAAWWSSLVVLAAHIVLCRRLVGKTEK